MEALIIQLKGNEVLRKKLFQIAYLSGLSGEIVVSLIYHKPLDENWLQEAQKLRETLRQRFNIDFIGRAKKQKIPVDRDFIIEKLVIKNRDFSFKHIENSFTQPNAKVNINMIEWAADIATNCEDDLLEFYCGAGNFSIPLAKYFNHVVGTEIAKPSVEAAQFNIAENQINNVTIVRLSAEEFVEALLGKRTFNRLRGINLSQFTFSTVLVDPPRAGLDLATLRCVQHFDNIIYISCNPKTLVENLSSLSATHTVKKAALFDQFPFTSHMESGVWLTRK
jgi:tRNA (uracil-5-)-methyltransferase